MDQVKACMDEMEFKHHIDAERSVFASGFVTENYKDEDGESPAPPMAPESSARYYAVTRGGPPPVPGARL